MSYEATLSELGRIIELAAAMNLTPAQLCRLLEIAQEKGVSPERFQKWITGGCLPDCLSVDPPDRNNFRQFLGLTPLQRALKIWKKIQVGTGLITPDDFRRALKAGGYLLGDWASNLFDQEDFKVASKLTEVDLVVASNADLGRPKGCTFKETYDLIIAAGHPLCEPEDGPQLRLQYPDQPKGERLILAMKPIRDSGGALGVFSVERDDDDRWLDADYGSPDAFGGGGCRFVFRARK